MSAPDSDPRPDPTTLERLRFDRQVRFVGPRAQERIRAARVLLVGCGATGGAIAQSLVRAGVGTLVLVDRDVVEPTNLGRQVLFEERHLGVPKALAAAETLARAGGPTRVEPHARHVDAENLPALAEGAALVLDGTDNLATRYLVNDFCVERGLPWVYCGVVGGEGLALAVLPGAGPCLRCVFRDPAPPGSLPTCESAGVVVAAVGAVGSLAAALGLRALAEGGAPARVAEKLSPALLRVDAWGGTLGEIRVARDPACPCCGAREFPFLRRPAQGEAEVLCGRETVQIRQPGAEADLDALAARLDGVATDVRHAGVLLRFRVEGLTVSLFPDGRALVEGTDDVARARGVYDRYVGA